MKATRRKAPLWRALSVLITALCVGLGTAAVSATAATGTGTGTATVTSSDTSTLSQLTLTSVSNGRNLDVQNGTTGAGPIVVTNSAPGYDEAWHINAGTTDSFTIVNNTTSECIDAGTPLRVQPCDGRTSEQWYLEPVAGSTDNAFMIRQASGGNCLDLLLGENYNDAWTDSYGCNGTAAQQWTLPTAAYQAARDLAVNYAAGLCQANTATCSWNTASQTAAAPLPMVCVSPVWYNDTSAAVPWTFQLNTTTGWTDQLTTSVSTKLSAGTAQVLQTEVDATLTNAVTLNLTQLLGNSLVISVPVGDYGWVALSELATEVTGTWTFDAQGFAWTAQDTVTVPLTSDPTGGSSLYEAKTSAAFTSCSA